MQAKRWQKDIGVKAIQEAVASIAMYRCDSAMVVTNREFTRAARRLADANAVELWDRQALIAKLLAMKGTPRFGGKIYCFNHQRSVSPAFAD